MARWPNATRFISAKEQEALAALNRAVGDLCRTRAFRDAKEALVRACHDQTLENVNKVLDQVAQAYPLNHQMREVIALLLHLIGVPHGTSTFIDEETITRGYGDLDDMGSWEYPIPDGVR